MKTYQVTLIFLVKAPNECNALKAVDELIIEGENSTLYGSAASIHTDVKLVKFSNEGDHKEDGEGC